MYYHISITARNARDESCDLYRLTRHFDVAGPDMSADAMTDMINEVKDLYLASWPMRGVAAPKRAFIPVDVVVHAMSQTVSDEDPDMPIALREVPAA